MRKLIRNLHVISIIGAFMIVTGLAALVVPQVSAALSSQEKAVCEGAGGAVLGQECALPGNTVQGTLRAVSDILIFVIGAIAVIMIIIGGIRYATSAGDQAQITSAKNTILYSVIGLIIAFMAYGIARFVVDRL